MVGMKCPVARTLWGTAGRLQGPVGQEGRCTQNAEHEGPQDRQGRQCGVGRAARLCRAGG